MSLSILLAPLAAAVILVFIASQLDTDEHSLLRMMLFLFALISLFIAGQANIDAQHDCFFLVNETHTHNLTAPPGSYPEVTHNHIIETCLETTSPSSITLFKAITWFLRVIFFYIFLYLAWYVFGWFQGLVKRSG